MAWDLKTRQYLSFSTLLGLTALLTVAAYWHFCPQWIYYRRGETYFFAQKFARAIPVYQEALAAGLKRPEALIHLGEAYLATEQFHQALPIYEQLVRNYPNNAGAVDQLAALYDQFGRVDEAIDLLRRHQQLWAGKPAVLLRLADLCKRQPDLAGAEELYRQALRQDPEFLPAQLGLAELLGWTKQYDESVKLSRQILAVHPDNRAARLNLARVLSWKGQREEAVREYRRLLGDAP